MPVHPLNWSGPIAQACKDHVQDIGPKGMMSHHSSFDQNNMSKQRMRKYGNIIACYGENLSFGCADPKEVMLMLIIDDGSRSRGHRSNIFSKEFNYMGCYNGLHKDAGSMCVINYAAGFFGKGETDPIEAQIDDFLKEEVKFDNMPRDVLSWKQKSKIKMEGAVAHKTTIRTLKMKDGSERQLDKKEERRFKLT